jgi:RNA polymerase sigma factor (sigma-70 family)
MTSPEHERRARFERLFEAHYAAVLAYALRRTHHDAASDVTAETFAVAWRRLDHVPRDDALPWLYAVARRVLANEHRGARRRAALTERLRVTPPPPTPPPEPAAGLLDAALARLPDRDREALLLVAWEDLSTAQAAQVMGCSATAMRVRLHRARRRLADALSELQPGPPAGVTSTDVPQELPA